MSSTRRASCRAWATTGPIEISKYQQFQWVREQLGKEGFNLPLPTGN